MRLSRKDLGIVPEPKPTPVEPPPAPQVDVDSIVNKVQEAVAKRIVSSLNKQYLDVKQLIDTIPQPPERPKEYICEIERDDSNLISQVIIKSK